MEQQDNFKDSRFGLFTASEIHRLLKGSKKKDELFGDGAMTYINEKIAECITGESKPSMRSVATDWGLDNETDAMKWFEGTTGNKIIHHGVANYKFYPYKHCGGCSPDGVVMDLNRIAAIIQAKCPYLSANHINYLRVTGDKEARQQWLKANEPEYYAQCQFEMMCVGVNTCYFITYDPRTIEAYHRMAVFELSADLELQADINKRLDAATDILTDSLRLLENMNPVKQAA